MLESVLSFYITQNWVLPLPDDHITLTSSGTTVGYQWDIGNTFMVELRQSSELRDPLDDSLYTIALNNTRTHYQILSFMESIKSSNINLISSFWIDTTYASERFPRVSWSNIGIVLWDNTVPVQHLWLNNNNLDISLTEEVYTYILSPDSILIWDWIILQSWHPQASCKRILQSQWINKNGIYPIVIQGNTLNVYCDMETDWGGWTLVARGIAWQASHDTVNTVWLLASPLQNTVAKLSHVNIHLIGWEGLPYVSRFKYDNFTDYRYHQWNNGYAPHFNNTIPSAENPYLQTRQVENWMYTWNWVNDSVPQLSWCMSWRWPFLENNGTLIPCGTAWNWWGITCYSWLAIRAACWNPWFEWKTEDDSHRSWSLWIR